ncbi:MAG: tetratricopeptide repeat protein [Acidobacteria bacterium]|nr:tetratricopeptide repeat protein [Acidobacteriota bacterium]
MLSLLPVRSARFTRRAGALVIALSLLSSIAACATEEAPAPVEEPSSDTATVDEGVVEATSLLGEPLRRPALPDETRARLEANLATAEDELAASPDSEDAIIWVGRRLAYLSRYAEAIDVFSQGIEQFPDSYRLRRHRGHRYISTRQLDLAIADLDAAAALAADHEDQTEPDGAPNALGIPLGTDKFNIWYHLALAHYLNGDFESALDAYEECLAVSVNPDLLVATTDWMVMTLRRMGRVDETAVLLEPITADMEIIENDSYHRRLLMYKGELQPEELLDLRAVEDPDQAVQIATQGYGVGNWYLTSGDEAQAIEVYERILGGTSWAAFGYIAAEADLARLRGTE